jgi:hypothetical protein
MVKLQGEWSWDTRRGVKKKGTQYEPMQKEQTKTALVGDVIGFFN